MSGGGLGTGVGGLLGTLAGTALAPATGGLSELIPAATGAVGAEVGNAATGSTVNPLAAALMGGVAGGLGGATDIGGALGIDNSAGLFGDTADTAASTAAPGAFGTGVSAAGTGDFGSGLSGAPAASGGNWGIPDVSAGMGDTASGVGSAAGSAPSSGGGLSSWIGSPKNALTTAMLGETGLSAIDSLLPKKKVNVGDNAAQVLATNPQFNNASLPQYNMQNTASPYTGNWYTYGQSPQTSLYNAMPQAAAKGGMIKGYAAGGRVNPLKSVMPGVGHALLHTAPTMVGARFPKGYAVGGPVTPGAMPPQAAPQASPAQQQKANPLQLAAVHKIGVAIGKHLKAHGYDPNKTPDGPVHGQGGGQDDAVPARLSDGEYVLSADIPAALGDGSSKEGAKKLDKFVEHIRAHKTSHGGKFPPKAKNPLSYLGGSE